MKVSKRRSLYFTVLAIEVLSKVRFHRTPLVSLNRINRVIASYHLDDKTKHKVISIACALGGLRLALVTGREVNSGAWGAFEIEGRSVSVDIT